ncbi:MAG: zinc protease [Gammaproteobacteria bacterium]|jgi:zinc protease
MGIKFWFFFLIFASPVFAGPQIQHWQTTSGASVYFVEAHELPMVDIQVTFDAGSARDPIDKKGLSAMTNSLLAEGAAMLNADEISFEFERLGANYGASGGIDSASVSLRSLAEKNKLDKALVTLRKVMAEPDFPSAAVERQRKRFLIGIQQKRQSPAAVASEAFYAAIYNDHPYAYPREGSEESIASISQAEIAAFHSRYYVASNATIAIVGDLDRTQAKTLAEELTQSLQRGEKAMPIIAVPALTGAKQIKSVHPSTQTHILLGQTGMKRGDPDYFPLYVGNHILGGSGLVSLLFKEIREKRGLSYSAYSYFSPMRENGPFLAGLATRADQAEEALKVLRENIRSFIKEGPSQAELDSAKKNITGGFPLRIDSNSNILAYATVIGFYNLPSDYLETFTARVEAVSAEDIRDAFNRRIVPDKLVTVMVGPDSSSNKEPN